MCLIQTLSYFRNKLLRYHKYPRVISSDWEWVGLALPLHHPHHRREISKLFQNIRFRCFDCTILIALSQFCRSQPPCRLRVPYKITNISCPSNGQPIAPTRPIWRLPTLFIPLFSPHTSFPSTNNDVMYRNDADWMSPGFSEHQEEQCSCIGTTTSNRVCIGYPAQFGARRLAGVVSRG